MPQSLPIRRVVLYQRIIPLVNFTAHALSIALDKA
jgi:hypothetical protein